MNPIKTKVKVTLSMKIADQGTAESYERKSLGRLIEGKDKRMLTYDEQMEEGETVHTYVTIQHNQVTMKRTGAVEMKQIFAPRQWTETIYRHPLGVIPMETYTEKLAYLEGDKVHKLVIDYQVKLQGQPERKHSLELTLEQEEEV